MNRPTADEDPPPIEPLPPADNECCGSGCDPCVYDVYNAARQRYFEELRAWQERQAQRARPTDSSGGAGGSPSSTNP